MSDDIGIEMIAGIVVGVILLLVIAVGIFAYHNYQKRFSPEDFSKKLERQNRTTKTGGTRSMPPT